VRKYLSEGLSCFQREFRADFALIKGLGRGDDLSSKSQFKSSILCCKGSVLARTLKDAFSKSSLAICASAASNHRQARAALKRGTQKLNTAPIGQMFGFISLTAFLTREDVSA
jgi:hypothetical protein